MEVNRDSAICQTLPNKKYMFLIEEIKEDKKTMGAYDHYKNDGRSSYDPVIGRLQRDIHHYTLSSKENRNVIDALITNISKAMKDPKDPGYKKASKIDIERWESECSRLQQNFVIYKSQLEVLQPKLDDCLFNRYIEESKRSTMKMLRDKFFMDADEDYLAKGVTWAMEYSEKNRIKLDFNTLPKC
jgi:hypothetical protein